MRNKIQAGFTLVELMVTVAIISILAALAYPSYTEYIVRANRSVAQSFMLGLANKQEQFKLDSGVYTTDAEILMAANADVSNNYNIVITLPTATTYTITATPIGGQLARDKKCKILTLNQTGTKGISGGTSINPADCW